MPNKYHQQRPKKPGLVMREQQVAHLEREARQFIAETGSVGPVTGNVALRRQLDAARSGLERQRDLAKKKRRY